MLISVIIPNYNGKELLETNLQKVISEVSMYCKREKESAEVIVIDDASRDESVHYLETYKESNKTDTVYFHFYINNTNLGFANTVNRGISHAKGKFLLLLNSDVVPEKNFLEPLLHTIDNENVFAVGCLDKSVEQGKIVERGRGVGKWHEGFLVHAAGSLDKKSTLWVSGGSGLFRRDIWEKLGGLNELYAPFYWEDIDLSYRALKAGYDVLFEKASTVIHEHEKGAIKTEKKGRYVKTIAYRNQILFVWVNITNRSLLLNHVLWLPIHIIRAVKRRDIAFIKGLGMAIVTLPLIGRERRKVNKLFSKDDKVVISEHNI